MKVLAEELENLTRLLKIIRFPFPLRFQIFVVIGTSKKVVYLDKFSVIANASQVRTVCRDLKILSKADKSSNAPPTKFVPGKTSTKSTK